jgi:hypothetical protein
MEGERMLEEVRGNSEAVVMDVGEAGESFGTAHDIYQKFVISYICVH